MTNSMNDNIKTFDPLLKSTEKNKEKLNGKDNNSSSKELLPYPQQQQTINNEISHQKNMALANKKTPKELSLDDKEESQYKQGYGIDDDTLSNRENRSRYSKKEMNKI